MLNDKKTGGSFSPEVHKALKKPQFADELFSHTDFYLHALRREEKPREGRSRNLLGLSRAKSLRKRVKVLFLAHGFQSQESRDMVDKMIKALSLSPTEAFVQVVARGEKRERLVDSIYATRAPYVVAFGAWMGNFLLEENERLTDMRGRFYARVIENPGHSEQNLSVNILTVFHPDFLLINPSLKAAVWSDLQLILNDGKVCSR